MMQLTGYPMRASFTYTEMSLVLNAGPCLWDVRVAGYIVSVVGDSEDAQSTQDDVLDFAIEQIQLWQAKELLAL